QLDMYPVMRDDRAPDCRLVAHPPGRRDTRGPVPVRGPRAALRRALHRFRRSGTVGVPCRGGPAMRIPLACLAIVLLGACRQAPAPAGPERPAEAPSPTPDTVVANFRCGDLLVVTVFDNAAGNITLWINGSRTVLPQAVSASGARYADEAGNEFWNKGDEATLTLDGANHACVTTE